jgi:hypothetical protein
MWRTVKDKRQSLSDHNSPVSQVVRLVLQQKNDLEVFVKFLKLLMVGADKGEPAIKGEDFTESRKITVKNIKSIADALVGELHTKIDAEVGGNSGSLGGVGVAEIVLTLSVLIRAAPQHFRGHTGVILPFLETNIDGQKGESKRIFSSLKQLMMTPGFETLSTNKNRKISGRSSSRRALRTILTLPIHSPPEKSPIPVEIMPDLPVVVAPLDMVAVRQILQACPQDLVEAFLGQFSEDGYLKNGEDGNLALWTFMEKYCPTINNQKNNTNNNNNVHAAGKIESSLPDLPKEVNNGASKKERHRRSQPGIDSSALGNSKPTKAAK